MHHFFLIIIMFIILTLSRIHKLTMQVYS